MSCASRRQSLLAKKSQIAIEPLEDRTVPSWLAHIGGAGIEDIHTKPVMDSTGNMYLSGRFQQMVDFDPGLGVTSLTALATSDGFAAKYDINGGLAWARRFGFDIASTAVDSTGSALFVTGTFTGSVDFTGDGKVDVSSNKGSKDAYLVKLNGATGQTIWFKTLGSTAPDEGMDVATDGSFVYVTGSFGGATDFDPGPTIRTMTPAGKGKGGLSPDAFVWKLDASGNYAAAWQIGGTGSDKGAKIIVDSTGLYLAGTFVGTVDFDPGSGVQTRTASTSSTYQGDNFYARYTHTGAYAWVQAIPVAFDLSHFSTDSTSLYVTGLFGSNSVDIDPGPGSFILPATLGSWYDVALIKYAKSDGSLVWAKPFGSIPIDANTPSNDYIGTTVVDPTSGSIYFGMNFLGANIDLDPSKPGGEYINAGAQNTDIYADGLLVKLDTDGNYLNSWHVGGPGYEGGIHPRGVINGTVYTAGRFQETANFPVGGPLTSNGDMDLYLMAIDDSPSSTVEMRTITSSGTTFFSPESLDSPETVILPEAPVFKEDPNYGEAPSTPTPEDQDLEIGLFLGGVMVDTSDPFALLTIQ
jgi:hypothetical protein